MSQDINFVKFLRGTEQQYENLAVKDKNTLYFIYDKTSTDEHPTGKLYLEKFLIGGNSTELNQIALKDLTDTDIGTLSGDEILKYNGEKWQPVLLDDILADAGLGNVVHSNIVKANNETELEAIKRTFDNTSNPGDIGILSDGTVYLSDGNNSWLKLIDKSVRNADIPGITSDISSIQSSLDNIYTKTETENKINELIAGTNHLSYEVKSDLLSIDVNDLANKNKVFLVLKSETDPDGANNNYDEYMIVGDTNPVLEKIGDWKVNLNNYIQVGDPYLLTDEQKQKLDNLVIEDDGSIAISGKVNAENVEGLENFISTHEYIKSVDSNIFNVNNNGKLTFLPDYVTTSTFNSIIGDMTDLGENRITPDSTIVSEINKIKESIIWTEMT